LPQTPLLYHSNEPSYCLLPPNILKNNLLFDRKAVSKSGLMSHSILYPINLGILGGKGLKFLNSTIQQHGLAIQ